MRLCGYIFFDVKSGKPLVAGFSSTKSNTPQIVPLWMKGTGISAYDIWRSERSIAKLISKILQFGGRLITSDYQDIVRHFDVPRHASEQDIYDLFLPEIPVPSNMDAASKTLHKLLPIMSNMNEKRWHKIAANAAITYQCLEDRGVMSGFVHRKPVWSMRTYSGRSKNTGFNVQGATAEDEITNPYGTVADLHLHFDWQAADIRMASILSGDDKLDQMSLSGDPYTAMMDEIGGVTRDECKIGLLSAINAMDISNPILTMFPDLREWIDSCNNKLNHGDPLESILGRKFRVKDKRRAPFNATMQGSIAHAMQAVIRMVRQELGSALLVEIHDSIVVTCRNDSSVANEAIRIVVDIMKHPFRGVLDSDPVFPVSVSIGKKWKRWVEHRIYY
jgi:hypothetical protein